MSIQAKMYSENHDLLPMGDNHHLQYWMENSSHDLGFNQLVQTNKPMLNLSQTIAACCCQMEKQNLELNQFIDSQSQRLKLMLEEHMSQQLKLILTRYETNAAVLINQKDVEIGMANMKGMELEELLKKMEMENQGWKRIVMHKESIVMSLRNTLSQIEEEAAAAAAAAAAGGHNNNNNCEDAESCCEDQDRSHNNYVGICRRCNSFKSSVIFLPCRHLCSCHTCEPFMEFCPVCKLLKNSTIQVFFS